MSPRGVPSERVLMVDSMSGANDFAVDLCHSLSGRCSLTVLTVENSQLDGTKISGRLFKLWPYFGGGSGIPAVRKAVKALVRLLLEIFDHRSDVVHSQYPRFFFIELLVFLVARPFTRKLVFTAHNAVPHERSRWQEMLLHVWYRLPHRIVVLSDNVRQEIIRLFAIRPEKIVVIPHGSYVAMRNSCQGLTPGPKIEELLTSLQTQLVVFQFGIIREYKGIETLIEAARSLPLDQHWHILIAGGGSPSLVNAYIKTIRALGLSSRITILHEFLSNPDLAKLTERADILVFPYHQISQSGALMLGLSFGKPCICSDIPGFREYLSNDEAIFFQVKNPVHLAAQIKVLLNDSDHRMRLGEAAWRAASGRYSWHSVSEQYLQVYRIQGARA